MSSAMGDKMRGKGEEAADQAAGMGQQAAGGARSKLDDMADRSGGVADTAQAGVAGTADRMATLGSAGGNASGTTTDNHTVVGVFDGPSHAEQALNALKEAGFTPEQVSVVAKDKGEVQQIGENTDMVAEGAGAGAVTGSVLGGLGGFLLGISALVIPGIGPIVGAGIIATTLAGAGIGAAAGGLIGALGAQGVPEDDARDYQESVRAGSVLLTVHATSDAQAQQAHAIFDNGGGGTVRRYPVKG